MLNLTINLAIIGHALLAPIFCGPSRKPELSFAQATGSPFAVGARPNRPVIADVNKDGRSDVLFVCNAQTGDGRRIGILRNLGDGRFRTTYLPFELRPTASKVFPADVNRDNALDIVLIEHSSYEVSIFLGDGTGSFTRGPQPSVQTYDGSSAHTHYAAIVDLNRDGNLDVLTSSANDNVVCVLLGDGKGGFAPAAGSPFPAGIHPYEGLTVYDLNGDGNLDVVVPNLRGAGVCVLRGDGQGALEMVAGSPISTKARPGFCTVTDINRDGTPDILVSHDEDPQITVFAGSPGQPFRFTPADPIRLPHAVWAILVTDINKDGRSDLVLGSATETVLIMLGADAAGRRFQEQRLRTGGRAPWPAVGDLNNDGIPDLVTSNMTSASVSVLLGS